MILVIGDSCVDIFVYGKCQRLCPDAPVPILIPTKKIENGGMAKNVYDNIKSIYHNVDLITNENIITKTRYVDEKTNQMMVRVDSENSLSERIKNLNEIHFDNYDIVIISDYCKGFLNEEDIEFICNNHKNVFIDTKKLLGNYCINAKLIKINEIEYENNIKSNIPMEKFYNNLIVTLGEKGCKYKDKIYPVEKVDIKDMTGAGDTFISALAVEFIKSNDVSNSIEFANKCSTIIVQHKGVNKIGDFINNK
jgi:D-beta-D-heptose 7-phosphate kinase/D-beta-D-heptose 1-phosphate adenosyltransferase